MCGRQDAHIDRYRLAAANALETAARTQGERDRMDTHAVIAILQDKRAEVMAKDQAGYFIVEWQELRDQVRRLIAQDSRYKAIKARSAVSDGSQTST